MKRIAVLTGAGMSADSGVKTFRDHDGLWEGHDVMQVATPEGWAANRRLVLEFYNARRRQLPTVAPNAGHMAVAALEEKYHVDVITQNVDNLHERAGSSNIVHLHGELVKARSTRDPRLVYDWPGDLTENDKCELGSQLRPHIVWFGEDVPMIPVAASIVNAADIAIIIGTSMQVYPAAGLVAYTQPHCKMYYVDPRPNISYELRQQVDLEIIAENASIGVPQLVDKLLTDATA